MAPGETAAWMRIWLPVEMPTDQLWQLRMNFPADCDPLTIIGYQTCINTGYSSLDTSAPGGEAMVTKVKSNKAGNLKYRLP